MREFSPREVLLQNLLAQSATLLFRSTKLLHSTSTSERENLIIEIEEYFEEAQAAIAESIREDSKTGQQRTVIEPGATRTAAVWQQPPIIDEEAQAVAEKLNYFLR